MTNWQRLLLATVVSAMSAAPFCYAVIVLSGDLDNVFRDALLMVAPVVSLIGVLLIGLPTHFFLQHRELGKPLHYAIPGFLAPAAWVVLARPLGEDAPAWLAMQALFLGTAGVIVALIFRLIALSGRSA